MGKARKFLFTLLFGTSVLLSGQKITDHLMPGDYYLGAIELFKEKKFHFAQQKFGHIIENKGNYSLEEVEGAYYYTAISAMELLNPDAEFLAKSFLTLYPSSGKADQMEFETGRYFFREKDFEQAVSWFEKVSPQKIQNSDKAEFFFSAGYSFFMIEDFENARLKFYEIKDGESVYSASSQYYYSHINYDDGNYQTALEGFEKLRDDSTFASIVPYYISQIYFLQEKYTEVISYAADFLEEVTEKRKAEVARIVAESHFKLKQYKEAIPYYNIYTEYSETFSEDDYYQSGYSYYKADDYAKAASQFEKISNSDSELGQNASYHLADCYIKLGEKKKAMIAFSNAAKSDFDPRIKEDALFNKAVLNYELNVSAFSESIRAFEAYIVAYPNSARVDEAYNYLVLAYLNTKNYKYALQSLDKIKKQTDDVKKAYQHIAFYRGIEMMANDQYREAIDKFDLSIKYHIYNKTLHALAHYWKGECYYRLGEYDKAVGSLNQFVVTSGAFQLSEYKTAHYNLGYALFKLARYNDALSWFRKYIDIAGTGNTEMLADAYNRAGDIAFLKNEYNQAVSYYDRSVALKSTDADYAMFQKAFAYGLMGNYDKKIWVLKSLLDSYPGSDYADDAYFEAAISYQLLNKLDLAQQFFTELVNQHTGSSYAKGALVQLGLIHYNADRYNDAISAYKKVVSLYPGSDEARSALRGLKNIYIEQNRVEAYLAYVNELGGEVKITPSETDSLLFVNAENIYFKGDCEKAIARLTDYLGQKGEEGPFTKRAYVYLADCYNQQGRKQKALDAYQKVVGFPGMEFKEQALLEASRINFEMKNYEKALDDYLQLEKIASVGNNVLEAKIGKMRCHYYLNDHRQTIEAAVNVLETENLDAVFRKQANYFVAKSQITRGQYNEAIPYLETLAQNVKTEEGAEAKYLLAYVFREQKKYGEAESTVYEFIKLNTPHQYWIAKSYLLLAEIFFMKGDLFQASHTVQSIIEYYDEKDDGIRSAALGLKDKIQQKEAAQKNKEESDLELNLEQP
jgi:tetratricopeptide (TPR) repeat protein